MSKTLGRLNMETFSALIRTDGTYPPWTAHTPDSKAAWQAAAEAVVAQYMKELTGCDEFQMGTFQIDNSKERAVIEAARRLLGAWTETEKCEAFHGLRSAVEALDSEEE